jgi:hypothetical protein
MSELREAVEKIRAGDRESGKRLLIEILRSDPQNEKAWLWLAITFRDPEKRRESLERVLRLNPDNQQAKKLLQKLDEIHKSKDSEPNPASPPPATPAFAAAGTKQERPFLTQDEPELEKSEVISRPEESLDLGQDYDDSREEQQNRSFSELTAIWINPFQMTERFFKAEIPYANTEDTLLSVFVYTIAAVLFSMVTGFFQLQNIFTMLPPELSAVIPNLGMLILILLFGSVLLTPISFYIQVGVQYLGARIFGGTGLFKSQAYIQGLVQVPFTILGGLISLSFLIPILGFVFGLIGFGISIFALIVNVRAIKAVHDLSTGRAVAAMIIPPIAVSLIFGCLIAGLLPVIGQALSVNM